MNTRIAFVAIALTFMVAGCATDRYPISDEICSPTDPVQSVPADCSLPG
ncbi:hypothetical protein [Actibacterium sp. D379-3]